MQVTSVAHIGLDYIDRLPASEVPRYAITALEREAHETLRWISLFQVPVAVWGGDKTLISGLRNTAIHHLGGQAAVDRRTPEQIAAEQEMLDEIKREVMRDFGPLAEDPGRLNEVHAEVGAWPQLRAA